MDRDATHLKPLRDEKRLEAVLDAIGRLSAEDVLFSSGADQLDQLSTHTEFEEIEPNPEGVFVSPDDETFQAACTVYVTLNYGGKSDPASLTDSYPATISGHFTAEGAEIDQIAVDVSSFYGPEDDAS